MRYIIGYRNGVSYGISQATLVNLPERHLAAWIIRKGDGSPEMVTVTHIDSGDGKSYCHFSTSYRGDEFLDMLEHWSPDIEAPTTQLLASIVGKLMSFYASGEAAGARRIKDQFKLLMGA